MKIRYKNWKYVVEEDGTWISYYSYDFTWLVDIASWKSSAYKGGITGNSDNILVIL